MLRRLWEGWKSFGHDLGNFQSRILLGIFYFFVVTPFGVAMRVFEKDVLHTSKAVRSSCWISRSEVAPTSLDEARKQF